MIIYKYEESDVDNMEFNFWSRKLKCTKNIKKIKEFLNNAESYTIFKDKPLAILAFFPYEEGKYECCIVADKSFGSSPKHAVKMKWLCDKMVNMYKPKRIQTTSEDNEQLNKWHEFLGLKKEKTGVIVKQTKNLILWSREWE